MTGVYAFCLIIVLLLSSLPVVLSQLVAIVLVFLIVVDVVDVVIGVDPKMDLI